jgi:hypothetical protein
MPTAYVLLTTEIGAESDVVAVLKKVKGVEEVHNLWGSLRHNRKYKSRHNGQTYPYHNRENPGNWQNQLKINDDYH